MRNEGKVGAHHQQQHRLHSFHSYHAMPCNCGGEHTPYRILLATNLVCRVQTFQLKLKIRRTLHLPLWD